MLLNEVFRDARIAHHDVGEIVNIEDLIIERPSRLIGRVLRDSRYTNRAQYFQGVIAKTCGLDLAADVIERAFSRELFGAYQKRSTVTTLLKFLTH